MIAGTSPAKEYAQVVIADPLHFASDTIQANRDWLYLQQVAKRRDSIVDSSGILRRKSDLERARRVRELGLIFWRKYPTDIRRFQWLQMTANAVEYSESDLHAYEQKLFPNKKNHLVDTVQQNRWESLYAELRNEFMTSPGTTQSMRDKLRWEELYNRIWDINSRTEANIFVHRGDLNRLLYCLLDYATNWRPGTSNWKTPAQWANTFLQRPKLKALGRETLVWFYDSLSKTSNSELRTYALSKKHLFELVANPLEMQLTALNGQVIDLNKMRGKVVLVDWWSLGCSSCIAAFPKIKALHDRYGENFQVVTVNSDTEDARDEVKKVYDKHSLPWPTVFTGAGWEDGPYIKQYGIRGVPHMFLIDQQGYLVDNGAIGTKELEEYLKLLLYK